MGSKGRGGRARKVPGMGTGNMLKQVQQLQAQMQQAQEDLADETVTASVGGGAVTIVMTGQQQVRSVTIDPQVVSAQDIDMLQDLVLAACNQAIVQARELAERKMAPFTDALSLPGLM